jgi:crotonyl-CoA reductase
MLVSDRGAQMEQGDVCPVWGATGGLGGFAVQRVKNGGGVAVGVASSGEKAQILREQGCDVIIDRREIGMGDGWAETMDAIECGKRLGRKIRAELGEDPRTAFDYVGSCWVAAC